MALQIELLARQHDREQFNRAEPSLNEWLQRMALQQQQKGFARTRVVVEGDHRTRILGYYALLPAQLDTTNFPSSRKLPRRLPCLLLGCGFQPLADDPKRLFLSLGWSASPNIP